MTNKQTDSQSNGTPTTRLNLTVSHEVKEVFSAIQKKYKFSQNAMMTRFIDLYFKYESAKRDEIIKYCDVTLSGDIKDSTAQFLHDIDLSDIPHIGKEITDLKLRLNTIENQLKSLDKADNQMTYEPTLTLTTPEVNTLVFEEPSKEVDSSAFSDYIAQIEFIDIPSTIKTFLNRTLDATIEHECGYDYSNYILNYNSLHKDKIDKVTKHINEYNEELKKLLSVHCENEEMCNALRLSGSVNNLQSYLTGRLGEEVRTTNLSLTELHSVISKCAKFTATRSFIPCVSNFKSPQMTIKTTLFKNYDFFFRRSSEFKTF